ARAVQALSPEELHAKWQKFLDFCGSKKKLRIMEDETKNKKNAEKKISKKIDPLTGKRIAVDAEKSKPAGEEYAAKLEKMREQYPNAYRPWKEVDDTLLRELFKAEMSVREISRELGRQPGGIRARLEKVGLVKKIK
ncbi:MAG: hypothetical protein WCG84_04890, partial [Candidatus Moraniibacteriota bacterium]